MSEIVEGDLEKAVVSGWGHYGRLAFNAGLAAGGVYLLNEFGGNAVKEFISTEHAGISDLVSNLRDMLVSAFGLGMACYGSVSIAVEETCKKPNRGDLITKILSPVEDFALYYARAIGLGISASYEKIKEFHGSNPMKEIRAATKDSYRYASGLGRKLKNNNVFRYFTGIDHLERYALHKPAISISPLCDCFRLGSYAVFPLVMELTAISQMFAGEYKRAVEILGAAECLRGLGYRSANRLRESGKST